MVELFTSQSCSDSRHANAILGELRAREDVIALSYSVSMWDFVGWRDTFAKPAFGKRHKAYARALNMGRRATPQIVVDGRAMVRGRDQDVLEDAISTRAGAVDEARYDQRLAHKRSSSNLAH